MKTKSAAESNILNFFHKQVLFGPSCQPVSQKQFVPFIFWVYPQWIDTCRSLIRHARSCENLKDFAMNSKYQYFMVSLDNIVVRSYQEKSRKFPFTKSWQILITLLIISDRLWSLIIIQGHCNYQDTQCSGTCCLKWRKCTLWLV